MPAVSQNDQLAELIDACDRLAHWQYHLARALHAQGVLPDTTALNLIARADQIDAVIGDLRSREDDT